MTIKPVLRRSLVVLVPVFAALLMFACPAHAQDVADQGGDGLGAGGSAGGRLSVFLFR